VNLWFILPIVKFQINFDPELSPSHDLQYSCPLCHQSVSLSLYNKITGIWREKEKILQQMKNERKKQIEKFKEQKAKLRAQAATFNRKKKEIIEQAIERKTSRLQMKLDLSKVKQERIEQRYIKRIENLESSTKERAAKLAKTELTKYRKEMRPEIQAKIKAEKIKAVEKERAKNVKLQNSFKITLVQMRAKSYEIEKQRKQILELQRQVGKQTTPQLEGLLYEKNLVRELSKHFPKDDVVHKGKGGDILQYIKEDNGHQAGLIVYECKRVKHYNSKHLTQALLAKEIRHADFAILVTNAMRKNTFGFFTDKEVLVVHATGVLSLAAVLRKQIIHIASMKLGQLEREKAVRMTLDYIEGPEFTNSLEAIIGETIRLHKELMEEIRKHVFAWRKRYDSYRRINSQAIEIENTSKAVLSGEIENKEKLAKSTALFPELLGLPDIAAEEEPVK
jgi:hypothetical protein